VDWFVVTSALSLAAMYGLLGIGISLTWSSIGMLNLAHGFTFALAGYGAWWASKQWVKPPTSGIDAVIVGAAGIGVGVIGGLIVGLIAFLPLHDRPNFPIRALIATLAISLAGTQIFLLWFGPLNKPLPKVFLPVGRALDMTKLEFGPISMTWDRAGSIVCATLLAVLVLVWVRLSRRGIQMRAMMQNPEGAALVGVSVRSTGMLVMGICGGMAGLSAVLLSSTFFVNPSAGVQPLAKGLVIALLGGLGSVPGAVIASILVGFTEALTAKYFGTGTTLFWQYVLVFGVLIVRPRGIGGLLDEVRE
jgi:branched-subunit amino acid ABC-type transport system permease component